MLSKEMFVLKHNGIHAILVRKSSLMQKESVRAWQR